MPGEREREDRERVGADGRLGLMLVLSSPSGAGKTTMTRRLLQSDPCVSLSVSATTRPPRPGEVDGRDYHFVSDERFQAMVAAGEFLEWAHVFGRCYGTPRAAAETLLQAGRDVVFDIDWQGAQQLRQASAAGDDQPVSIFLLPPSLAALSDRLHHRQLDSEDVIAARMERATAEIDHWAEYAYVLVNDDADRCLADIRAILAAERLRRRRNPGLERFVARLLAGSPA